MAEDPVLDAELDRLNRAIGVRLRVMRKVRGLSQTEVGAILGVTFRQIQKYENGSNRLSAASLAHLCTVLNCYPVEILNGANLADSEILNLVVGSGFEEEMIRVSKLGAAQRASVKNVLSALLDNVSTATAVSG